MAPSSPGGHVQANLHFLQRLQEDALVREECHSWRQQTQKNLLFQTAVRPISQTTTIRHKGVQNVQREKLHRKIPPRFLALWYKEQGILLFNSSAPQEKEEIPLFQDSHSPPETDVTYSPQLDTPRRQNRPLV